MSSAAIAGEVQSIAVPTAAAAALLASNAIFHIAGAIQTRRYSPGIVTGIALYLPLAIYGYWQFMGTGQVSIGAAVLATLIGGSYHVWAALAHRARVAA